MFQQNTDGEEKLVSELNFIGLWCSAALHRSPIRRPLLALVLVRNWPSSERHGPSAVPEITWRDSTCRKRGSSSSIKIQRNMSAQWWLFFLHPSFWVNYANVLVVWTTFFPYGQNPWHCFKWENRWFRTHLFFLMSFLGFFSCTGFALMLACAFLYISSTWGKEMKHQMLAFLTTWNNSSHFWLKDQLKSSWVYKFRSTHPITAHTGNDERSPWSYRVWCDTVLDEARELFLVGILVLLHQVRHVVGHVHAHDVFAMNLCIELFALCIVSGKALQTAREGRHRSDVCTKPGPFFKFPPMIKRF